MSLVAWFPLNGNLNNNGLDTFSISGTPAYIEGGKVGQYAYDLSKRVTFTIPSLVGATEFSISFWCKINPDENLSTNWVDILSVTSRSADDTSSAPFRFETCYGSVTNVGIGAYEGGTNSYIGTSNAGTLTSSKDSIWYHVCVVANDSAAKVRWYINGIQKVVQNYNGGHLNGYGYFGEADKVNGGLQDVRFYNHALSVKEVKELAKGLVIHLPLDWGANPNMIKNSYTWMNKNTTAANTNSCTVTKSVIEDDYAPCRYVYKCVMTNPNDANKGSVGGFFNYTAQGIALTDLTEGETYTYSFWAKADSANTSDISLSENSVCEGQTKLSVTGFGNLSTSWRKHTVTFQWTKTTGLTACFYVTIPANSTQTYYLCGIKLEKGSKATPYIPNVEETAYTMGGYASKYYQDCSGYNRNVTISGTGISNAEGAPRGTGTNWNGTGRIYINKGFPIGTTTSFTINTWVKVKSGATQTVYNDVLAFYSKNNSGTAGVTRLEFTNTAGTNLSWFGNLSDGGGFCNYTITAGTWTMLTLVSDGTTLKNYKDGVLVKTYTPSSSYNAWQSTGDAHVGDQVLGNVYYDQADFRVYATALSADDIKELYQVSAQIDKTGKIYCNQLVEE